uniref:Transcription termination factor MTERF15, mitochondrial n=1 Tax=Nelumbo nucifera TaxID=4432 RepID=A0A822YG64_NELNU|nr:TPA_asm: hypothetical protein HUJ06_010338 [Nelumbo nucifera]
MSSWWEPRSYDTASKITSEFTGNSEYRQQVLLANLLQRYGFPTCQLHELLGKSQFLLNFNLLDVEKSLGILLAFKLSQNSLVSIISSCPGVLELGFLRKWEMVFSELDLGSVSPLLIQNVLEHSRRFQLEPADLCNSVRVLKAVGFHYGTVSRVLEEFPRVIMIEPDELHRRIEFLKGIGIRSDEIDKLCYSFPGILGYSVEGRFVPLFNEFKELGFKADDIRREVIKDPRILTMEVGELSRCLELMRGLKCRLAIKEKILCKGIFRAGTEVKLRVNCLHRHGLTLRDAFKVLQREPRSIIYELGDIEKKIDFLINRMECNIYCLVEVPEYLGVNFEKQIVPRYSVIEYLRSKGALGFEVGLKGLIKSSRLRFYNLYVKPYPECEKIFGRFSTQAKIEPQHPVGLWKLFKPQNYPQSKEDLRSIKLFMESLV